MMTQSLAAFVRYRIEQADEALDAARILLREGSLRASVNRSLLCDVLRRARVPGVAERGNVEA
jgi:hypothetical protein